MKLILLNNKEKKALVKLLYNYIRAGDCPYELTTILEKISVSEYERAFGIMNREDK